MQAAEERNPGGRVRTGAISKNWVQLFAFVRAAGLCGGGPEHKAGRQRNPERGAGA
jgi:hypothetical protein